MISGNPGKLKSADFNLALSLAKQANDLTKGTNHAHASAVAEAHYRKREYARAIETMQHAIDLVEESTAPNRAAQFDQYKARLDRFQQMKTKRENRSTEEKPGEKDKTGE